MAREIPWVDRGPVPERADVAIVGGGMAGLGLAYHLRTRFPRLDVVVLDREEVTAPHPAFKVGESSTEIGAWYWTDTLQLGDELDTEHIRKMGLRYFLSAGPGEPIGERVEVGPRAHMFSATYQIDRGRFEHLLGSRAAAVGARCFDRCRVRAVDIGPGEVDHVVRYSWGGGEEATLGCRWVIDASGRRRLLARQLGLKADSPHRTHAAWFRLDSSVRIDGWVGNDDGSWGWQHRVPHGGKWTSTNHLMGRGYWVWIIPLGTEATSIGLVADPDLVDPAQFATFDGMVAWLHEHEPDLADAVEQRRGGLLDYQKLRNLSYSCSRVFSADRWAMSGESSVFLDPLYSPGADFIALANDYIVDLIGTDLGGGDLVERADRIDRRFRTNFEQALPTWLGAYPLMGHPTVWPKKVAWDTLTYFSMLGFNYINGGTGDVDFMTAIAPLWSRFGALSHSVQRFLGEWGAILPAERRCGFVDMSGDLVRSFNAGLAHPLASREELPDRLAENLQFLESLARALMARASWTVGRPVDEVGIDPYRYSLDHPDGHPGTESYPDDLPRHHDADQIGRFLDAVFSADAAVEVPVPL